MHLLDKFKYCPVCGSPRFEENDFKSKRCADCGFVYYFNAAGAVVSVIVNERGELLVARRACEPAKGTLDLIGGFADCGEGAEDSMVREIQEETGLEIKQTDLKYLFSIPDVYEYSGLTLHTMDIFYLCHIPSDSVVKAEDDVAECFWASINDINPKDFGLDSIRMAVERILSNPEIISKK
jgi:NADH pyrophosphatase NudC (nudix superfamily)